MSDRKVVMKTMGQCIDALLAGETLVFRNKVKEIKLDQQGMYAIVDYETFSVPSDWHIKPEPRVIYVNEYDTGFGPTFYSLDAAEFDRALTHHRKARTVKFVEVVDE